ncbi:hypothetical protein B0J12DRAFT_669118 [Macrophomina phaseolina]|uniref:Uncharacterized protein n=1 Tax=Macrophomina phaseolina TaxID=35725 RepID=A0ABQ8G602_9PEZI|nr:hypothetical protein B0J12DRAFT_669118 [Macrophomina phaseolina]
MSPTPISFNTRPFTAASFGIPLAIHHKHHLVDPFGDEYCLNSVLQLHVHNEGHCPSAYIIKGVHFPNGCQNFNIAQRYQSVEHYIIAELGGLDLESGSRSSLGLIMAISPRKRRIAIATWKRIQVWVVHPNAFFERQTHTDGSFAGRRTSTSSRGSTAAGSDLSEATSTGSVGRGTNTTSDRFVSAAAHANVSVPSTTTPASTDATASNESNDDEFDLDEWPWIDECGWDYYSCYPRRNISEPIRYRPYRTKAAEDPIEIVSLQPTELPSQGVVFALAFNGEDNLWAWTEHGPVRWTFDASCEARREEYELGWQVREMDVQC